MAADFNSSMIMTNDFYQENFSDDMSPSSYEIEKILGTKLDEGMKNWLDSMSGKEAYELLKKLIADSSRLQ